MINEIPTAADFEVIGVELLNVAWDAAISLLCDLDLLDYKEAEGNAEHIEYWRAARVQLSSALVVVHQGCEFLIKARIASVDPLRLLANAENFSGLRAFSSFRTIDAHELIKVHDAISAKPIGAEFATMFEKFRRKRNSIVHSIDKRLWVFSSELLKAVLLANHNLGSERNWVRVRRAYLDSSAFSVLNPETYANHRLIGEFAAVKDLLSSGEMKKYFTFDTKQRNFICPRCAFGGVYGNDDREPRTALLTELGDSSAAVWCFVCDEVQSIERFECTRSGCSGSVISYDWQRCLTCGENSSR
jgi:hypothetical protein